MDRSAGSPADSVVFAPALDRITLKEALHGIAEAIRADPDGFSGKQLSRMLWLSYDLNNFAKVWSLGNQISLQCRVWTSTVYTAAFLGILETEDIIQTLKEAGEIERKQREKTPANSSRDIEESIRDIERVLKRLQPDVQNAVVAARLALIEAQNQLSRLQH